ncbi:MAG: symmetrical bis(5'-nucleosyl)-tetraphosphatase [Pseudomonadota bacterium]
MATYVVGDIQGCYTEFCQLLEKCNFRPGTDQLWLVGDLINRGPGNLQTINHVMRMPGVKVVLGNHDLHFLAVASGVRKASRSDTLGDLLNAPNRAEIISWLRTRPLIHVDEPRGIAMVHAGIPPVWTMLEAQEFALEVERALQGERYLAFLAAMYGDQPDTWDSTLEGFDRLRLITNYFTRLRFCTRAGKLELSTKTDIAPAGYAPWFSFERPDTRDYKILFGHWAALEGNAGTEHAIALDTGCVWGGALTALRLDDHTFFSVPAETPR